jgi:hypothetical protein
LIEYEVVRLDIQVDKAIDGMEVENSRERLIDKTTF